MFRDPKPYAREWQWPWIFSDSHLRDKGPSLMGHQYECDWAEAGKKECEESKIMWVFDYYLYFICNTV